MCQVSVYLSFVFNVNKSVLNWTQVCQLLWKTKLHEIIDTSLSAFRVVLCKYWCNSVPLANTLAYYNLGLITGVKSFMVVGFREFRWNFFSPLWLSLPGTELPSDQKTFPPKNFLSKPQWQSQTEVGPSKIIILLFSYR